MNRADAQGPLGLAAESGRRCPEDLNAATGTMTVHRAPPRLRTLNAGAVDAWTPAQCGSPTRGFLTRPRDAPPRRVSQPGATIRPSTGGSTRRRLHIVAGRRVGTHQYIVQQVPSHMCASREGRVPASSPARYGQAAGLSAERSHRPHSSNLGLQKQKRVPSLAPLRKHGGDAQIRTGGKGFAGLCLTTWPHRR